MDETTYHNYTVNPQDPLQIRSEICRTFIFHCLSSFDWFDSLPVKEQFDPEAVKALLPHLIIYELPASGGIKYRLVGTHITQLLGFDPTGQDYLEFVPEDRQQRAEFHLRRMCAHPYAMGTLLQSLSIGQQPTIIESFGFPFDFTNSDSKAAIFALEVLNPNTVQVSVEVFHQQSIVTRNFLDLGFGIPRFDQQD